MKRMIFFAMAVFAICHSGYAQNGIITTIAGTGTSGSSGDGGPATSANIGTIQCVAAGNNGNVFITDPSNNTIRKVSPSGIITRIAGNGTAGFSGDGGPATLARLHLGSSTMGGLTVDNLGNVYVCDINWRIRKIDAMGIISTIAGTGTTGATGDGGPATNAQIYMGNIVADNLGNIYLAQYTDVRKINAAGIITTVAGNDTTWGYSGDGGPAIAARLGRGLGIAIDNSGNLYIADSSNGRIRMVNSAGIIKTIAGNGAGGSTGDGGPSTAASLNGPFALAIDKQNNIFVLEASRIRRINNHGIITTVAGNGIPGFAGDGLPGISSQIRAGAAGAISANNHALYIGDGGNNRVRKLILGPDIPANDFSVNLSITCKGAAFSFLQNTYAASSHIKTFYGDGTSDTAIILPGAGIGYANVSHIYNSSGTYTVKNILNVSGIAVDSVQYSFIYECCNFLPLKIYLDTAAVCNYDSTSNRLSTAPIKMKISKNGTPVDTVALTSGIYYKEIGVNGDVFSYSILSHPPSLPNICPAAVVDTLQAGVDTKSTKYMGLQCTGGACNFDLDINAIIPITGTHDQWGNIYVRNVSSVPVTPTVTLSFSPKWVFDHSDDPATVAGNTLTWNLGPINNGATAALYYVLTYNPATGPLTIADTVHTSITATPTTGDMDPTNNQMIVIDTVKAGCDPNEMFVAPQGYISSGDQLTYTIDFMNTGNDTAHNIYVMDTLSDFEDPSALTIVTTTHAMNITMMYDNICHNIVKFDFPKINLLDSSHHNACTGNVVFSIKTKNGLPAGTQIFNQAGIYFDLNSVVMTNTVQNIIGYPSSVPYSSNSWETKDKVLLYPNPATDELTIKTEQNGYHSFTIANVMGQVLIEQPLTGTQTRTSVKMLPPGMYYVTVSGADGVRVEKFIKR